MRSTRKSFFAAFNLYAWKFEDHINHASKLGPQYDCGTCSKERISHYDPANDCPQCPLTRSRRRIVDGVKAGNNTVYRGFIEECAKRFGKNGEWPFDFEPTRIIDTYDVVATMLAENKERIAPMWDETIATLARLIRARKAHSRFAAIWRPEDGRKN